MVTYLRWRNYPHHLTSTLMAVFTSRKQQQNFKVAIEGDMLYVEKPDGKQAAFPLNFYPKLQQATEEERNNWTITAYGIKWNDLGVEIPV